MGAIQIGKVVVLFHQSARWRRADFPGIEQFNMAKKKKRKKEKEEKSSLSKPKAKVSKESSSSEPEILVRDKRFWVRKDWDPEERSASRKPSYVEELEESINKSQKQVQDVRDAARKFRDEGESFRQRMERDVERKVDNLRVQFLSDMLEVLDNLERSLSVAEQSPQDDPAFKSLSQGLRMVHLLFLEKLARHGVEKVDLLHKPYDPEMAEALDMEETEDAEKDNLIVEVFSNAYRLDQRIIRPARVRVAKFMKRKTKNLVMSLNFLRTKRGKKGRPKSEYSIGLRSLIFI